MEYNEYIYFWSKYLLTKDDFIIDYYIKELAIREDKSSILRWYLHRDYGECYEIDDLEFDNFSYNDGLISAVREFREDIILREKIKRHNELKEQINKISILSYCLKKDQLKTFNDTAEKIEFLEKEIGLSQSYINLKKAMLRIYRHYTSNNDIVSLAKFNQILFFLIKNYPSCPSVLKWKREYDKNNKIIIKSIKQKTTTTIIESFILAEALLATKKDKNINEAKKILLNVITKCNKSIEQKEESNLK